MNAAIYARKSTDQKVSEEAKSVTRQVDNARAFATSKGWTVNDAHIFIDDGISGTEFKKRPALMRMMHALTPKAPFQMLIVSEQKSIGRESVETAMTIKQLAQAGVDIIEYVHGLSLVPRSPTAKLLSSVQGFSDEDHAVKTGERVHESHAAGTNRGHVVGGRVFGYHNRVIFNGEDRDGNPLRSHVERVINEKEKPVVERIFSLYDSGEGLKRIAMQLNSEQAVCPKPFVRKDPTKVQPVAGWAPGSIRAILMREIYRGVVIWNKSRKRDDFRQVNQRPRPESEWLRTPAEHLRIIDEPLWKRVQSRRHDAETLAARMAGGRLSGRPPKTATQNLLAGLASCGICGGGLVVETTRIKKGEPARQPEYVCYRHRSHGSGVCPNQLRMKVADLNDAVLQAVEEHALTPEAIEQVIRLSERDDVSDIQAKLARERKDIEKRTARLVAAIETGGDATALVAKLREHEARLKVITTEAASLQPIPRLAPVVIENRLAEWRRLLRQSTTQGRTVLQRILRGRLTFTPHINPVSGEVDGYEFEGPTRFDKLFTGIACERPKGIDTGSLGCEGIGPEDTFDGDYGRLLEQAHRPVGKVLASPPGFEPGFWP